MEGTSQVSARLLKVDYGPMYADAHCHLEMFDDPEGTVAMAKGSGVGMIITAGSDARSNVRILELAKDGVYGVVGICPEFAERDFAHIGDLLGLWCIRVRPSQANSTRRRHLGV